MVKVAYGTNLMVARLTVTIAVKIWTVQKAHLGLRLRKREVILWVSFFGLLLAVSSVGLQAL